MRLIGSELAAIRGGRPVFEHLAFAVSGGELLAVTGPNGAGKSTLLRLIAGLLPSMAGTVSLDPSPEEGIGPSVHYLGHLDALKPSLTVIENLRFWQRLWASDADVDEALDTVGILRLADLPASTLSAGQKRRAALARLLLAPRPIWLLDEPGTALDADGEAMLGTLIRKHLDGRGIVIAATHRELPIVPAVTLALGSRA